jgi:cysteine synthase
MDILHAIGNTSIVRLRKVVPTNCADILVKLESENPTGSLKDRMAQAVISRAEEDGRLKPGDTVVEYTGGSTGTSLALVCAAKGYRLQIVSSDAFSQEKRDHMAALGAELTLVRSDGGLTTKKLILDMIEAARVLSQEPHTYWTDQLNNRDSIAGYFSLGEEIWRQTKGEIDAFVHCVGTAASLRVRVPGTAISPFGTRKQTISPFVAPGDRPAWASFVGEHQKRGLAVEPPNPLVDVRLAAPD